MFCPDCGEPVFPGPLKVRECASRTAAGNGSPPRTVYLALLRSVERIWKMLRRAVL